MNMEDKDKKQTTNQYAFFYNYYEHVDRVTNIFGAQPAEDESINNSDEAGVADSEATVQPRNLIFKKFHNGKRIDFKKIRKIIEEKLVIEMTNKYEWYAAYRTLYDLKIMEMVQLSKFTEQMNTWYPDATIPCNKDSLGDYATGHTGKPYTLWTIEGFRADKKKGQSESGFNTLSNHCNELKTSLTPIPILKE